ncbi:MAG: fibronectin type III domain-containing protein [Rubrivivax sp.]|nr:fibronectin type III domain-containing protein [Rubrivivax sp.]
METTNKRWRPKAWLASGALALLTACGGGGGTGNEQAGDGGAAPAGGFLAVGSSARTASLHWTPVPGATGYTVERRAAAGAFVPVATLAADADSYLDDALAPNTAYTYRLVPTGTSARAAEQVATTSADLPVTSPAGAASGAAAEAAVPATGGSVETAGGQARLLLAGGAVPAGTAVSLQPITNTAPGGQGAGVRVHVAAVPARPLTLVLRYDAALDGQADGLGVAVQRPDGSWLAAPVSSVDKAARTLTVQLPPALAGGGVAGVQAAAASRSATPARVSLDLDVVTYLDFYLSPRQATVRTGATQLLVPHARTLVATGRVCVPDATIGCLWMPILDTREVPFENSKAGYARRWVVFAEEGGTAALGTVTPRSGSGAVYRAPAQLPTPNPVLVSFVSTHERSGRTLTLTASIRVGEPVWTGIFAGAAAPGLPYRLAMQGVWTAVEGSNGTLFHANGTQAIHEVPAGCRWQWTPDTVALPPGALTIDHGVDPPRYTLDVGSDWGTVNKVTCNGQVIESHVTVPGRLQVQGTVGANGTRIEGEAEVNGVRWSWSMTSAL